MITQRQNKHGDFILHLDFKDKDGGLINPPQRLDVRLTTEQKAGAFVAEYRSDGSCTRCKRSPGGIDVFVSLSRNYIGAGRILLETISYLEDDSFPEGERRVASKTSTPVVLWDGPSDSDVQITGTIVL